ncbi:MAG: ABC transporter substrate-binding protein [Candidatus Hydromicrobium sp.]|nr:ABC transporter substrate-binding protein [Candidatus Hydromicrobium sp.]
MSKKIMLAVVVILILSLIATLGIFSGCKGQATEESLGSPVEVVDGEENIVKLAAPARKIIVLAQSALEIIDGLGAMELVVEVDNWSVMMAEPLAEGFEGAGDVYGLNIERIAELNPDILITITGGPEDDYQKVRELGIEIYRVIDVKGIEGVYDEIANISKIIGLEDKGKELVSELKKGVDEIYNQIKDLSDEQKPRVFYEVWNDPLMGAGADTFISDLIEKSGGVNILSEDNLTGWPEYSVEKLIEKNPDVIIAPMSLAADSSVITGDERFSSIDAVTSGRVYVVPDNPISRPNQNLIKALQMLSRAIHPEIFGKFEVIE